jgi:hypothetical protein
MHPFDHSTVAEVETGGNRYVDEISAYAAKRKQRGERKNAAQETIGPTPERLAKAGAYEEILVPIKEDTTRATAKVARVQTMMDAFSTKLTEEDRAALARAAKDFMDSQVPSSKMISGYGQSAGGSSPGPRHGGVPDRCREAFNRIEHLRAYVGPTLFQAFKVLVIEVAERAANPHMRYSPWTDKATAKGVSYGVLLCVAWQMRWYYERERGLTRGPGRSAEEINAARQIRQERIAREKRG